jgi:hypothetical protein
VHRTIKQTKYTVPKYLSVKRQGRKEESSLSRDHKNCTDVAILGVTELCNVRSAPYRSRTNGDGTGIGFEVIVERS